MSTQKRKEQVETTEKVEGEDIYKNHKVDEHQVLAKFAQEFDCDFVMFEQGVAGATAPAHAHGHSEWNGNIVRLDFDMSFGDFAFKGEARFSFDTVNKKFQSIWIDNMATGQYMEESVKVDPVVPGQPYTIALFSPVRLDAKSQKQKKGRSIYVFNVDGTVTYEAWSTLVEDGAKELQEMKIVYKPKK